MNSRLGLVVPSEVREIGLTQGYRALVDEADYAKVAEDKWRVARDGPRIYVARGRNGSTEYMHRRIMDMEGDTCMHVDHINGNGLDNRRANLRIVTPAQNHLNRHNLHPRNTSGVTGVYWDAARRKWRAHIGVNYKTIILYTGNSFVDACEARYEGELEYGA